MRGPLEIAVGRTTVEANTASIMDIVEGKSTGEKSTGEATTTEVVTKVSVGAEGKGREGEQER